MSAGPFYLQLLLCYISLYIKQHALFETPYLQKSVVAHRSLHDGQQAGLTLLMTTAVQGLADATSVLFVLIVEELYNWRAPRAPPTATPEYLCSLIGRPSRDCTQMLLKTTVVLHGLCQSLHRRRVLLFAAPRMQLTFWNH